MLRQKREESQVEGSVHLNRVILQQILRVAYRRHAGFNDFRILEKRSKFQRNFGEFADADEGAESRAGAELDKSDFAAVVVDGDLELMYDSGMFRLRIVNSPIRRQSPEPANQR